MIRPISCQRHLIRNHIVLRETAHCQFLMPYFDRVTDFEDAASVKIGSSVLVRETLLCVLYRQMRTSSTLNSTASVRLFVSISCGIEPFIQSWSFTVITIFFVIFFIYNNLFCHLDVYKVHFLHLLTFMDAFVFTYSMIMLTILTMSLLNWAQLSSRFCSILPYAHVLDTVEVTWSHIFTVHTVGLHHCMQ